MAFPQFTIRAVLATTCLAAVVLMVYRYDDWAAFSLLFNVLLFTFLGCLALAWSVDGSRRSFLNGFAIFGMAHLLLSGSHTFREYLFPACLFKINMDWISYPATDVATFLNSPPEIPAWPSIVDAAFSLMITFVAGYVVQIIASRLSAQLEHGRDASHEA